jgi:hypothetical protein
MQKYDSTFVLASVIVISALVGAAVALLAVKAVL